MNLSSPNIQTEFDASLETATPQNQPGFLAKMDEQIDALPSLDAPYKAWAKKDLRQRAQEGRSDLMEKYVFYDRMAKIREDILKNVSPQKRPAVHKIIDELLNQSTQGRGREIKAESMKRIEKICREYASNKSLLRFTLERFEGEVGKRVYNILNQEDRAPYEKYYARVFTPEFWHLWENASLTPQEFPHIRSEFLYFSPLDLQQHVTLDEVKKIPPAFYKALIEEVNDTFRNGVFPLAEKKKAVAEFKKLKPTDLYDGLLKLLSLRQRQEKSQVQFLLQRAELEGLIREQKKEAAQKKLEFLVATYGEKVAGSYKTKIESLLTETTKEKASGKNLSEKPDASEILRDIKHNIFTGTEESLTQARRDTRKLGFIDPREATRQQELIDRKLQTLKGSNESQKKNDKQAELGLEKQMKIKFIDGCIEHARRTKEAAAELGIPTDHPDFWSPEGCKNRVKWLKGNGKWDEYAKLNAQDKNIPSQKKGSMHYRWLDLRTGSNLTAGKAEQGLKYLDRYKDSGYRIAALGAGFSVDWKSYGSPTYDPDRFIDMCNAEKARIESSK